MSDPDDDDTPTGYAPTELGQSVETEANTAWSLDDEPDEAPSRFTPGRITAAAVGACVVVIAVAAGVAAAHLLDKPVPPVAEPAPSSAPATTSVVVATSLPSPTAAALPPPPPPPLPSGPPAPVTLPIDGHGKVHVRTISGNTVCAIRRRCPMQCAIYQACAEL